MNKRRRDTQNWASVSLGIVSTGTILAAATAAGIFAMSSQLSGPGQEGYPGLLITLAAVLAIGSLITYGGVLVLGLATPFFSSQASQRDEAFRAAVALNLQAFSAIIAVVLIIFARWL